MDKNFLINVYRVLVFIRNNIRKSINIKLLTIIINSIELEKDNDYLVKSINGAFSNKRTQVFGFKRNSVLNLIKDNNGLIVARKDDLKNILIYSLTKLKLLLENNNFEEAYDLVDAIHILPEIFADGRTNNLNDYWEVYIEPFRKKWGDEYFSQVRDFIKYMY